MLTIQSDDSQPRLSPEDIIKLTSDKSDLLDKQKILEAIEPSEDIS